MITKYNFKINVSIMKNKFVALSLFLLIAHLIYSQHLQVVDGDTVAVVPIELIRTADGLFLQRDSLQAELTVTLITSLRKDSLIQNYGEQIDIQKGKGEMKDMRISTLEYAIRQKDEEIKAIKPKAFLAGVGTGAGAILFINFLLSLFQ